MNKNSISFIIGLLVVAAITAFVFYMKAHTPKYKWAEEYSRKSEQPYGLKCFYETLKAQSDSITLVNNESYDLLDTGKTNTNLIAVDSYFAVDSFNIVLLLDYMNRGNRIFIASDEAPLVLMESMLPAATSIYGYDQYKDTAIKINFTSAALPYQERMNFHYQFLKTSMSKYWNGYYGNYFDQTFGKYSVIPVSYFNDTIVNCFYIPYGKGALIVHSNPIVFTNYNLIQKNGFKHANNILSYLNNGPIYWNEFTYSSNGDSGSYENNPLKFLFSHYTLKTGWYFFLISIIIFVLFRSKREQRIIPVIYKNKNTSIEFAKAIGSLYYQKKAHHHIANELYTIFLADMRARYQIDTSAKNKELIEQIANLTETKKEVLVELFDLFNDIKCDVNAKPKELIKLHQALEYFYKMKK